MAFWIYIFQKKPKVTEILLRAWKKMVAGKYLVAFRLLVAHSSSARKHFRRVMVQQIQKELRRYASSTQYSETNFTVDSFNWITFLTEMQSCLPFLYDAVSAVRRKNRHSDPTGKSKIFGTIFGQLLFMHNPGRYREFQRFNGVEVWKRDGNQRIIEYLKTLGLTLGRDATRAAFHKVTDSKTLSAKEQPKKGSKPLESTSATQNKRGVAINVPQNKEKRHPLLVRPIHEDSRQNQTRKPALLRQRQRCPQLDKPAHGDVPQNKKRCPQPDKPIHEDVPQNPKRRCPQPEKLVHESVQRTQKKQRHLSERPVHEDGHLNPKTQCPQPEKLVHEYIQWNQKKRRASPEKHVYHVQWNKKKAMPPA